MGFDELTMIDDTFDIGCAHGLVVTCYDWMLICQYYETDEMIINFQHLLRTLLNEIGIFIANLHGEKINI